MRVVCRAIAIVALFGILATFALIQRQSQLMNGIGNGSGETLSVVILFSPLFTILATTTYALSFASGVVGMVMAGQRRQRIWFAILLVAVSIEIYGGIVISLIPAAAQFIYTGSSESVQVLNGDAYNPFFRLEIANYVAAPLFAPFAALVYSLRAQPGPQSPPDSLGTSGEDAGIGELEYSRLDDASTS